MTRYLGGVIGGALDRKTELNPADWTNTKIAEDYSYIIPVPSANAGGTYEGHENAGFGSNPGQTIAISGDGLTAVVGISGADQTSSIDNTGAVIVYEWDASIDRWKPTTSAMCNNGLYASDRQADDFFGISVAIDSDGSTIAVGAYFEDTGGTNAGKVYIFEKGSGWVHGSTNEVAMLRTSTDTSSSNVGRSLALSADGQTLLVGAPGQSSSMGTAFIFEKPSGGWVTATGSSAGQEAILSQSDAGIGQSLADIFGFSVALSADGSTALVGAYGHDGTGDAIDDAGAAYIFERPGAFGTWANTTEDAILTASDAGDGSVNDYFSQYGISISGDGSTIAIGKYFDDGVDNTLATSGAVYIYEKGAGWATKTEDVVFRPDNLRGNDDFGQAVAISTDGNTIVVGANQSDYYKNNFLGGNGAGSVYIFEKGNGWVDATTNQVAQLFSPVVENPKNHYTFDELGKTISITADGSRILAGGDDVVLVFHKPDVATYDRPVIEENKRFPRVIPNTGILDLNTAGAQETDTKVLGYGRTQVFTASDVASGDNIGSDTQTLAISRDGLTCIVGSPDHDTGGIGTSGAAYVFEYTNNNWTQVAKLTSSTGPTSGDSFGESVAISDDGSSIVIGASGEDVQSLNAGALFVFERPGAFGTWADTTEDAYLHPASSANGYLGSVAISGDGTTIFGGAYDEHSFTNAADTGAAYVFEKGAGWTNGSSNLVAEFNSDSPETDEYFGTIVKCSQDGTILAIGAPRTDHSGTDNGTVYIFEKGVGWSDQAANLSAKLTASDANDYDYLTNSGKNLASLSISDDGNTVVAGAYTADFTTNSEGKVYIWEKNGSWTDATEDYILFEAGAAVSSTIEGEKRHFGMNVHITGNGKKIFVASPIGYIINNEENSLSQGTVHVFEKGNGWKSRLGSRTQIIHTTPAYALTSTTDGNTLFAGAKDDDTTVGAGGAVYVYNFNGNGKTENRVLSRSGFGRIIGNNKFDITYSAIPGSSDWANNPKDFAEYDISPDNNSNNAGINFGSSVALSYDGKRYVVGAPDEPAVYIYDFVESRWQLNNRISRPTTNGALFGNGVSISDDGNTIAVSARSDLTIHVYEYINNGWKKVAELTPSTSPGWWAADIRISGDGNTIVAGSQSNEGALPTGGSLNSVGGLWVFEKPISGWTNATQDAVLYKASRTTSDFLGYTNTFNPGKDAVAISKDGSIISASIDGLDTDQGFGTINGAGGVLVFKRPGAHGTWANGTESAQLEKDYLGSTSGNSIANYGMDMSADGNHIIATDFTNKRIYVWEKSIDSDWSNSLSNTYVTLQDAPHGLAISDDGNTIISTADDIEYLDNYATYNYIEVCEKGAGWNNNTSNRVRMISPWHTENATTQRGTSAISGDGSVYAFGAYNYDRFAKFDIGQSYVWDSKKYKERPVMNKTGMFSLKDMYQSKLTES